MSFRHVLATTDFSEPGNAAVAVAIDVAARYRAQVSLLTVQEGPIRYAEGILPANVKTRSLDRVAELRAKLSGLAKEHGLEDAETWVISDASPVEGILDHIRTHHVDLVVMSTRGRSRLERLLIGSVTERVVRHAPCAVLTVRGPAQG